MLTRRARENAEKAQGIQSDSEGPDSTSPVLSLHYGHPDRGLRSLWKTMNLAVLGVEERDLA